MYLHISKLVTIRFKGRLKCDFKIILGHPNTIKLTLMRKIFLITLTLFFGGLLTFAQDSEIQLKEDIRKLDDQISLLTKERAAKNDALGALSILGWKKGGLSTINFSNFSYNDAFTAVSGAKNAATIDANLNLFANYGADKYIWENRGTFALGYQSLGLDIPDNADDLLTNWKKNIDRLELFSKIGYKFSEKVRLSLYANFLTQFSQTRAIDPVELRRPIDGVADSLVHTFVPGQKVSNIFAPAYLEIGPGIDWAPNDIFTVFFSPAALKLTFLGDSDLQKVNDDHNLSLFGVEPGETSRMELGAKLSIGAQTSIGTGGLLSNDISIVSVFNAYANYLGATKDLRTEEIDDEVSFGENIDIDWTTTFGTSLGKYVLATLDLVVRRDMDQTMPYASPEQLDDKHWQVSNLLKIGLAYQF